jgi:predicted metalloendopeptidase
MTLHAADRDPSVDPGADFYRFANGGWMDSHPIPAGFGAWGSFEEIQTRNEEVLHELVLRAAGAPADDLARAIGDYFASGMDTAAIDGAGLAPVQPFLDAVAAVASHREFLELLPELQRNGLGVILDAGVTVDHDDSTRYLLWLVPSGLGLPDRDNYTSPADADVQLRAAYVEHLTAQLVNSGSSAAAAASVAPDVLAFETRLAEHHLRAEERRDPRRTLNRYDLEQLRALAPELDLPHHLVAVGAGHAVTVNVTQPAYVAALHGVLESTDLAVLRAYATFHVIRSAASALASAIEDEAFAFYGRRIEGKQQPKDRYQRVLAALGQDMGEALGHLFVADTFPASAKERALVMVHEILEEMRHSLRTRTWMGEETRARALAKLDSFGIKIGYPDVWRDWSGLRIDRASYAANRLAASRFEIARGLARIDEPVDTTEWEMPPHAVNAYYHPTRNEIVFPAGILQQPMFDADADDAVNYGGIGTVIAHEITHGFDDSGRRFDADGAFRDWWTEADEEHFTALADRLVAQFEGYVAIGDVPVNGRLTLGENIADLGGITLAQRAHARVCAGAPDVDGLSPAQRFFLANACIWRANVSEELARSLAVRDPHSPRHLRVSGPLSNSDAFQEAFGLDDTAAALRPRGDRIEIW